MLHMVINTHNAESCAFRGEPEEQALVGAFDKVEPTAAERGIEVRGSWVNRAAHEIFVLLDAPSSHAVEELLLATGLVGRTHSRILPVVTPDQAIPEGDERLS